MGRKLDKVIFPNTDYIEINPPTKSLCSNIVSFPDGASAPLPSLKVGIEPQQDLHGYDAPWVGGAGKNKLQVTATTLTTSGVTFTVNADGTISTSGTATGDIDFYVGAYTSTGATYSASGCPSGGATDSTYWMFFGYMGADSGSGVSNKTIASGNNITARIYVKNGTNMNGKVFKPMIEVGSTISTFAPYSNICPINGHTETNVTRRGKNLFDINKVVDLALGSIILQSANYRGWYMPVHNGETFTISRKNASTPNRFRICFTTKLPANGTPYYNDRGAEVAYIDGNNLTQITVTVPNDRTYKYIFIYLSNIGETITESLEIQVELGDTPTTYEPYNKQTYNVEFKDGSNPLTVYGGTLDVVSGVLTVAWIRRNMGSLTYTKSQSGLFQTSFGDIKKPSTNTQPTGWVISSIYKEIDARSITGPQGSNPSPDGVMAENEAGQMYFNNLAYTEVTDFKSAMDGVDLVYKLATPQTYQLTPTQVNSLLGSNNVWADTGDICVTYVTQEYNNITAKIAETAYNSIMINGHTVAKDVPSNAIFTDHHAWTDITGKPTTISGYGITDAKIASGTITLGSNTITPLTSSSTLNAAKLSGTIPSSCYTDTNNAVTQTPTDSTNATYELLFSGTADNTEHTEGARKSEYATFNPSKHAFTFGTRKPNSTVGNYSHAEGYGTTASDDYSHAEGLSTTASGYNSHAEGNNTTASSSSSHAEGNNTTANGYYSHAEGLGTIANHKSQHVFGEYNIEDSSSAIASARGNYVEIVGKGDSNTPSNARTLDWDGNEWLAGTLTTTDVINSSKWDGTNTSLKTAISAVNSKVDNKNTGAFFISFNNATVKNSTITNLGSHTFAAGGWLIEYFVVFSSNATGIRRILISNTSTGDVRDRFAQTMVQATSGTETRIQVITIQSITADATLYFNAVQNSGSNLTASTIGVKGVKLY